MTASPLRAVDAGDLIPRRFLAPATPRMLEAAAVVVPGRGHVAGYVESLRAAVDEFAAWDGRLVVSEPDGAPVHRLLVVDRYNQVYAVHDETDVQRLPDPASLVEWFRFLATACPECGVVDDPLLAGPTP